MRGGETELKRCISLLRRRACVAAATSNHAPKGWKSGHANIITGDGGNFYYMKTARGGLAAGTCATSESSSTNVLARRFVSVRTQKQTNSGPSRPRSGCVFRPGSGNGKAHFLRPDPSERAREAVLVALILSARRTNKRLRFTSHRVKIPRIDTHAHTPSPIDQGKHPPKKLGSPCLSSVNAVEGPFGRWANR